MRLHQSLPQRVFALQFHREGFIDGKSDGIELIRSHNMALTARVSEPINDRMGAQGASAFLSEAGRSRSRNTYCMLSPRHAATLGSVRVSVFEALRLFHGGGRRLQRTDDALGKSVFILRGSLGQPLFVEDRKLVHRLHLCAARPQSVVMLCSASQISLLAASSPGKCPRVLMTLRNCALMLSIALVVFDHAAHRRAPFLRVERSVHASRSPTSLTAGRAAAR